MEIDAIDLLLGLSLAGAFIVLIFGIINGWFDNLLGGSDD